MLQTKLVPIGSNCLIAQNLKTLNLREVSLPFDWIKMTDYYSLSSVADIIKTDFKYFFEPAVLIKEDDTPGYVHNTKYNSYFYHQNYLDPIEGHAWLHKLNDAIDDFNSITTYYKSVFVYAAEYGAGDFERIIFDFKPIITEFKETMRQKNIHSSLVILHTINGTKWDKEHIHKWNVILDTHEPDDPYISWRRFIIDTPDNIFGDPKKFLKSLSGIL